MIKKSKEIKKLIKKLLSEGFSKKQVFEKIKNDIAEEKWKKAFNILLKTIPLKTKEGRKYLFLKIIFIISLILSSIVVLFFSIAEQFLFPVAIFEWVILFFIWKNNSKTAYGLFVFLSTVYLSKLADHLYESLEISSYLLTFIITYSVLFIIVPALAYYFLAKGNKEILKNKKELLK